MTALELVKLPPLMERTSGRPEVTIGLIDAPVAKGHPDLEGQNVRELPGASGVGCSQVSSAACRHGTFVAGMLLAKRDSGTKRDRPFRFDLYPGEIVGLIGPNGAGKTTLINLITGTAVPTRGTIHFEGMRLTAPAICPGCRLAVRPIFPETVPGNGHLPSATPQELAAAILEATAAGARVLNLSAAVVQPSPKGERDLQAALDYAARRGVVLIAAAGNQGVVGSSVLARHPWVIPVAGCDLQGRLTDQSNLGGSIGKRGLLAPAEGITSLGSEGEPVTFGGTSAAAPFVTGTVALLWSEFPAAPAAELLLALGSARRGRPVAIVPPLLDAWAAYQALLGRAQAVSSRQKEVSQ
jgi:subtilisin family serine protease